MILQTLVTACQDNMELSFGNSWQDLIQISTEIEKNVHKNFNNEVDQKYKQDMRMRVLNLRSKNNPMLVIQVLDGTIPAKEFANLKPEEMASDAIKRERKQMESSVLNERRIFRDSGSKSEVLKCPKCKKNNCSYTQLQTRSADEPMTTFCFCNDCGNRWKFC